MDLIVVLVKFAILAVVLVMILLALFISLLIPTLIFVKLYKRFSMKSRQHLTRIGEFVGASVDGHNMSGVRDGVEYALLRSQFDATSKRTLTLYFPAAFIETFEISNRQGMDGIVSELTGVSVTTIGNVESSQGNTRVKEEVVLASNTPDELKNLYRAKELKSLVEKLFTNGVRHINVGSSGVYLYLYAATRELTGDRLEMLLSKGVVFVSLLRERLTSTEDVVEEAGLASSNINYRELVFVAGPALIWLFTFRVFDSSIIPLMAFAILGFTLLRWSRRTLSVGRIYVSMILALFFISVVHLTHLDKAYTNSMNSAFKALGIKVSDRKRKRRPPAVDSSTIKDLPEKDYKG